MKKFYDTNTMEEKYPNDKPKKQRPHKDQHHQHTDASQSKPY